MRWPSVVFGAIASGGGRAAAGQLVAGWSRAAACHELGPPDPAAWPLHPGEAEQPGGGAVNRRAPQTVSRPQAREEPARVP
eukprot:12424074-Heterocapsa_arctica.AAC.1